MESLKACKLTETYKKKSEYKNIQNCPLTKRPTEEILHGFEEAKAAHVDLAGKHEAYCMFFNDEEYDEDEQWMTECTDKYTRFTIEAHEYIESIKGDKVKQAATMVESNESGVAQSGEVVVVQANDACELEVESSAAQQNTSSANKPDKPLLMKHEKPKMPMFYGDVRKYFIFKADFQHAVGK